MGFELTAPDGDRCFGFGVNEDGRATCEWRCGFCECRLPNLREVPHLQRVIRDFEAEESNWGLTPGGKRELDRARKRLLESSDSDVAIASQQESRNAD